MPRLWFIFLLTQITSLNTFGASFDCSKASTDVEKLICSDHEVGYVDEALSKVYKLKMNALPEGLKLALRKDQRAWIKVRNRKCNINGRACKESYIKRISELMVYELDKTSGIILELIKGVWQVSGAHYGSTAWYNNAMLITEGEIIFISGSDINETIKFEIEEEHDSSLILKAKNPISKKGRLNVEDVYYRFNLNQCSTKGISTSGEQCYRLRPKELFGFCMYISLEGARNRDKDQCFRGASYYRFSAKQYNKLKEMSNLL